MLFVKFGKNACVKAPSPKIRRNKFGILKAIKKRSLNMPAPRIEAVKRSLISPKILEVMMPTEFEKKPFINIAHLVNLKTQ